MWLGLPQVTHKRQRKKYSRVSSNKKRLSLSRRTSVWWPIGVWMLLDIDFLIFEKKNFFYIGKLFTSSIEILCITTLESSFVEYVGTRKNVGIPFWCWMMWRHGLPPSYRLIVWLHCAYLHILYIQKDLFFFLPSQECYTKRKIDFLLLFVLNAI